MAKFPLSKYLGLNVSAKIENFATLAFFANFLDFLVGCLPHRSRGVQRLQRYGHSKAYKRSVRSRSEARVQ